MASQLHLLDTVIFDVVRESETKIEAILDSDVMYFYGEIRIEINQFFRNFIEKLALREDKKDKLAICISTPGGSVEVVEKMVEVVRHHYNEVNFIVPDMAMSAGTIFCMSGDKIYMDYSSSLGPIDPQVPDRENKYLVPALGYLDKINDIILKSRNGTITPVEFALIEKQDLAMLRLYEQAKELSIALLKKWLVQYKFKDWETHRTTNPGSKVTEEEKKARAEEIAMILSNNNYWHSHSRMIGMNKLKELRLDIDDLSKNKDLHLAVRRYCDTLSDYLKGHGASSFLHSRHIDN